jgi:cation diffusion facilitator family transporter
MHTHSIERWAHDHVFLGSDHHRHERRTWLVVGLTATMMVAEIIGGHVFGSMAVVADGWHMSTHAAALSIAALSYRFARTHAHDSRFSFGTGKIGELAGFSSAIILAVVALFIGYESVSRLLAPVPIRFDEATLVAAIGLAVNLLSAWLLFDHDHHHAAGDDEAHGRDTNIRAAYLHVLADALTSILAIVALLAARFLNWVWLDPVMAIVGALVIAQWSRGLIRSAGAVLLDTVPSQHLVAEIRERLECGHDRVTDLHLWRLGPGHSALIVTIISDRPEAPVLYKERLAGIGGLSHVTVEVHRCESHGQQPAAT